MGFNSGFKGLTQFGFYVQIFTKFFNIKFRKNPFRMRWAGHVARMEKKKDVHRVLARKPEGKRPLGKPRRRWDNNIKMNL